MSNICEECGNEYTFGNWCRPCQINSLKNYATISNNEKINDFIQKMQSKIVHFEDIVFEWIPFNQFNSIKKINGFTNAIWKDGPMRFNFLNKNYERVQNTKVSLKYSQNIIDKFLNEV
jgi:hypothetical protein